MCVTPVILERRALFTDLDATAAGPHGHHMNLHRSGRPSRGSTASYG
ncbi:hypothetical protein ABZV75_11025 [Streptomyces flaveolus]